MQLSRLVFPAPFGPIMARISPVCNAEAYLVENFDSAERKIQALNSEKGITTLYSHRFLRLYRLASW